MSRQKLIKPYFFRKPAPPVSEVSSVKMSLTKKTSPAKPPLGSSNRRTATTGRTASYYEAMT